MPGQERSVHQYCDCVVAEYRSRWRIQISSESTLTS